MELSETTFSDSIKVDRDNGVIRGVKVLGRTSKNGREYSDKALTDAVRIYEGVKVRFDHPPRSEPGKERQFIDSFGRLERLRLADDGVYADLPFKKAHPLADLVCESAERFSKDFGLSHNAEGMVTTKDGKTIVESITRARGVDVVDSPASTQGLFESDPNEPCVVLKSIREDMPMGDSPPAMADMPASHDKQLKGAMEKMILSIFRDDSIDSATTAKKIAQCLKHYDKLDEIATPGGGTPAMAAESQAVEQPTATPIQESTQMPEQVVPNPATPAAAPAAAAVTIPVDGNISEDQFRFCLESVVKENNELKTELAKERAERISIQREVKARRLLESKGREANPYTEDGRRNVDTLLKIESESIWPTLIDSWPAKSDGKRPIRTGSVMESGLARRYHSPLDVHDGKSLVAAIFE